MVKITFKDSSGNTYTAFTETTAISGVKAAAVTIESSEGATTSANITDGYIITDTTNITLNAAATNITMTGNLNGVTVKPGNGTNSVTASAASNFTLTGNGTTEITLGTDEATVDATSGTKTTVKGYNSTNHTVKSALPNSTLTSTTNGSDTVVNVTNRLALQVSTSDNIVLQDNSGEKRTWKAPESGNTTYDGPFKTNNTGATTNDSVRYWIENGTSNLTGGKGADILKSTSGTITTGTGDDTVVASGTSVTVSADFAGSKVITLADGAVATVKNATVTSSGTGTGNTLTITSTTTVTSTNTSDKITVSAGAHADITGTVAELKLEGINSAGSVSAAPTKFILNSQPNVSSDANGNAVVNGNFTVSSATAELNVWAASDTSATSATWVFKPLSTAATKTDDFTSYWYIDKTSTAEENLSGAAFNVTNTASNLTTGAGSDTINNSANSVTIDAGGGASNNITNTGTGVTIKTAGEKGDVITDSNTNTTATDRTVIESTGEGGTTISLAAHNASIKAADKTTITIGGTASAGDAGVIIVGGSKVTIASGYNATGNDVIEDSSVDYTSVTRTGTSDADLKVGDVVITGGGTSKVIVSNGTANTQYQFIATDGTTYKKYVIFDAADEDAAKKLAGYNSDSKTFTTEDPASITNSIEGATFNLSGDGNVVTLSSKGTVTSSGAGDSITIGASDSKVTATGKNVTIKANDNAEVIFNDSGSGEVEVASGKTGKITANGNVTVKGSGAKNITVGGNVLVENFSESDVLIGSYDDLSASMASDNSTAVLSIGEGKVSLSGYNTNKYKIKIKATADATDEKVVQYIEAGTNPDTAAGFYNIISAGLDGKTFTGTAGNDSIVASTVDGATVSAGAGNDVITAGSNASIVAASGNNVITAGEGSTVEVGSGSDTISIGASGTVRAGTGPAVITLTGSNATIYTQGGSNTIKGDFTKTVYHAQNTGTDTIENFKSDDKYYIEGYDESSLTFALDGSNVKAMISGSDGFVFTGANTNPITINNQIYQYNSDTTLGPVGFYHVTNIDSNLSDWTKIGTNVADSVTNDATNGVAGTDAGDNLKKIQTYSGDDIVNNAKEFVSIDVGAGNDTVTNSANNVTISSSSGANIIENTATSETGKAVVIKGGSDVDSIKTGAGGVEITAGKGNDIIEFDNTNTAEAGNRKVIVNAGDGNDVLTGYKTGDIIQIGLGTSLFGSSSETNPTIKVNANQSIELKSLAAGDNTVITLTDGTSSRNYIYQSDTTVTDNNNQWVNYYVQENTGTGEIKGITLEKNRIISEDTGEITGGNAGDYIEVKGSSTQKVTLGTGSNEVKASGAAHEITTGETGTNKIEVSDTTTVNVKGGTNTITANGNAVINITGGTSTINNATGATTAPERTISLTTGGTVTVDNYDAAKDKFVVTDSYTLTIDSSTKVATLTDGATATINFPTTATKYEVVLNFVTTDESTSTTSTETRTIDLSTWTEFNVIDNTSSATPGVTTGTLTGTSHNDSINNDQSISGINALGGDKNVVINTASGTDSSTSIFTINSAGTVGDTVDNSGSNVAITTATGSDSIKSTGNNVSINAGNGTNTIDVSGSDVSILGGTGGGNTVNITSGATVIYEHEGGTDVLTGFEAASDKLLFTSLEAAQTLFALNSEGTSFVYDGKMTLTNVSNGTLLLTTNGTDEATLNYDTTKYDGTNQFSSNGFFRVLTDTEGSTTDGVNIVTGTANSDSITLENVGKVVLGGGNDIVALNSGGSVQADSGYNSITGSGGAVSVVGGTGDDTISLTSAGESTIDLSAGGKANITFDADSSYKTTITAGSGDLVIDGAASTDEENGRTLIYGDSVTGKVTFNSYSENDVLQTTYTYGKVVKGTGTNENDVIVNDKITLVGAATSGSEKLINIGGNYVKYDATNGFVSYVTISGDNNNQAVNINKLTATGDHAANVLVEDTTPQNTNVNAQNGNNIIVNHAEKVSITAGTGKDTVQNDAAEVTIELGASENSIVSSGASTTIKSSGTDNIDISGGDVSISASGTTTINSAGTASILLTAGSHTITRATSDTAERTIEIKENASASVTYSDKDRFVLPVNSTTSYFDNANAKFENGQITIANGTSSITITGVTDTQGTVYINDNQYVWSDVNGTNQYVVSQLYKTTGNDANKVTEIASLGTSYNDSIVVQVETGDNEKVDAKAGDDIVYVEKKAAVVAGTGSDTIIATKAATIDASTTVESDTKLVIAANGNSFVTIGGTNSSLYSAGTNVVVDAKGMKTGGYVETHGGKVTIDASGAAGTITSKKDTNFSYTNADGSAGDTTGFVDITDDESKRLIKLSSTSKVTISDMHTNDTLQIVGAVGIVKSDEASSTDAVVTMVGSDGTTPVTIATLKEYATAGKQVIVNSSSDDTPVINKYVFDDNGARFYNVMNATANTVGTDGSDSINIGKASISVDAGKSDDIVYNEKNGVTILGGEGNDTINNVDGNNVSIKGGDGDDVIESSGRGATIYSGKGSDKITSTGDKALIIIDEANTEANDANTITTSGESASINATVGNNTITLASGTTTHDRTITISDNTNTVDYGVGDTLKTGGFTLSESDVTTVETNYVKIKGTTLQTTAYTVEIKVNDLNLSYDANLDDGKFVNKVTNGLGSEGNDNFTTAWDGRNLITNTRSKSGDTNVVVTGKGGNDTIVSSGLGAQLKSDGGSNTIWNTGNDAVITGSADSTSGSGSNTIYNSGTSVSIAGAKSDTIYNEGANTTIKGGGGSTIYNKADGKVTIALGASDTVKNVTFTTDDTTYTATPDASGTAASVAYSRVFIVDGNSGGAEIDYREGDIIQSSIANFDQTNPDTNGDMSLTFNTAKITLKGVVSGNTGQVITVQNVETDGTVKDTKKLQYIDGVFYNVIELLTGETGPIKEGATNADKITNEVDSQKVVGGGGNDIINNSGNSSTVTAGSTSSTNNSAKITNTGDNVEIKVLASTGSTIKSAGSGNQTIDASASSTGDLIDVSGTDINVKAGAGNDTVNIDVYKSSSASAYGEFVPSSIKVSLGGGDDTLSKSAMPVTLVDDSGTKKDADGNTYSVETDGSVKVTHTNNDVETRTTYTDTGIALSINAGDGKNVYSTGFASNDTIYVNNIDGFDTIKSTATSQDSGIILNFTDTTTSNLAEASLTIKEASGKDVKVAQTDDSSKVLTFRNANGADEAAHYYNIIENNGTPDAITGTRYDDSITATGSSNAKIELGDGDDIVTFTNSAGIIEATSGSNSIKGGKVTDKISLAGSGSNTVDVESVTNSVISGTGADVIKVDSGKVVIDVGGVSGVDDSVKDTAVDSIGAHTASAENTGRYIVVKDGYKIDVAGYSEYDTIRIDGFESGIEDAGKITFDTPTSNATSGSDVKVTITQTADSANNVSAFSATLNLQGADISKKVTIVDSKDVVIEKVAYDSTENAWFNVIDAANSDTSIFGTAQRDSITAAAGVAGINATQTGGADKTDIIDTNNVASVVVRAKLGDTIKGAADTSRTIYAPVDGVANGKLVVSALSGSDSIKVADDTTYTFENQQSNVTIAKDTTDTTAAILTVGGKDISIGGATASTIRVVGAAANDSLKTFVYSADKDGYYNYIEAANKDGSIYGTLDKDSIVSAGINVNASQGGGDIISVNGGSATGYVKVTGSTDNESIFAAENSFVEIDSSSGFDTIAGSGSKRILVQQGALANGVTENKLLVQNFSSENDVIVVDVNTNINYNNATPSGSGTDTLLTIGNENITLQGVTDTIKIVDSDNNVIRTFRNDAELGFINVIDDAANAKSEDTKTENDIIKGTTDIDSIVADGKSVDLTSNANTNTTKVGDIVSVKDAGYLKIGDSDFVNTLTAENVSNVNITGGSNLVTLSGTTKTAFEITGGTANVSNAVAGAQFTFKSENNSIVSAVNDVVITANSYVNASLAGDGVSLYSSAGDNDKINISASASAAEKAATIYTGSGADEISGAGFRLIQVDSTQTGQLKIADFDSTNDTIQVIDQGSYDGNSVITNYTNTTDGVTFSVGSRTVSVSASASDTINIVDSSDDKNYLKRIVYEADGVLYNAIDDDVRESKITGTATNDRIYVRTDSVTVTGGAGKDSVEVVNKTNVTITLDNAEADSVKAVGAENKITASGQIFVNGNKATVSANGQSTISVADGAESKITGSESADSIVAIGDKLTVEAGNGDDTVLASGEDIVIYAGEGEDVIYTNQTTGTGAATIFAGEGKATVKGNAAEGIQTLDADGAIQTGQFSATTTYLRTIALDGENAQVLVDDYTATDIVSVKGSTENGSSVGTLPGGTDVLVTAGTSKATLKDALDKVIKIMATNTDTGEQEIVNWKYIEAKGDFMRAFINDADVEKNDSSAVVSGTNSEDYLENTKDGTGYLDGRKGDDIMTNYGKDAQSIYGGEGNDTINNAGESASIYGGAGADDIRNAGKGAYLSGDAGDDVIRSQGDEVSINGGAGNDLIITSQYTLSGSDNYSNGNVTVIAGEGVDTITNAFVDGTYTEIDSTGQIRVITRTVGANGTATDKIKVTKADGTSGDDVTETHSSETLVFNRTIAVDANMNGSALLTDYHTTDTIAAIDSNGLETSDNDRKLQTSASGNDIIMQVGNAALTIKDGKDKLITVSNTRWNGSERVPDNGIYTHDEQRGIVKVIQLTNDVSDNSYIDSSGNYTEERDGADRIFVQDGFTGTSILAGDGANVVNNYVDNKVIVTGKDVDVVYNTGGESTIDVGTGNDSVFAAGDNVYIDGGNGNDVIYTILEDNQTATIRGGADNDTISGLDKYDFVITKNELDADGNNYATEIKTVTAGTTNVTRIIQYDSGADVVVDYTENDKIQLMSATEYEAAKSGDNVVIKVEGSDNNKITLKNILSDSKKNADGSYMVITVIDKDNIVGYVQFNGTNFMHVYENITGDGDNLTYPQVAEDNLIATASADSINNTRVDAVIDAGSGNDIIYNSVKASINAGAGADTIISETGDDVSIDAGADNDIIHVAGNSAYIVAGAGNDLVSLGDNSESATVAVGTGNDTVTGGTKRTIVINAAEGANVIQNYSSTDTLYLTGAYEATKSGDDVVIKVGGNGQTTLKGALNNNNNIISITDATDSENVDTGVKLAYIGGDKFVRVYDSSNNDFSKDVVTAADHHASVKIDSATEGIKIVAAGMDNIIENAADGVDVSLGTGNDSVINSGKELTIEVGSGNDTVVNTGDDVSVIAGDGNDYLDISGSDVSVNVGAGNDTVVLVEDHTDGVYIDVNGSGANVIQNLSNSDTIAIDNSQINKSVLDGSDAVLTIKNGETITVKDGKTTHIRIHGNNELDTVLAYDEGVKQFVNLIDVVDDDTATDKVVTGTDSAESIDVSSETGGNLSINAGAGNDWIHVYGAGNTIVGGAGNDSIEFESGASGVIVYNGDTDGLDVVKNYTEASQFTIESGVTSTETIKNGNSVDAKIASGKGTIVIKDYSKNTKVDINGSKQVIGQTVVEIADGDGATIDGSYNKSALTFKFADDNNTNTYVIGNDSANTMIGNGAASLYGGKGKDVFEVSENDVIMDYTASDDKVKVNEITSSSVVNDGVLINGAKVLGAENVNISIVETDTDGKEYTSTRKYDGDKLTLTLTNTSKSNIEIQSTDPITDIVASSKTTSTTVDGSNSDNVLNVTLGSGADYITGSGKGGSINAGAGNDTIDANGASGPATVVTGAGSDLVIYNKANDLTITDYAAGADTIQTSGDGKAAKVDVNGTNLAFDFGGKSLNVNAGATKRINFTQIDTVDTVDSLRSAVLVVDKKGVVTASAVNTDSATLDANIDVADQIVTKIDASKRSNATTIITNTKADVTVTGGSGNDTIYGQATGKAYINGGKGNDVFVYAGGDDTIADYNIGVSNNNDTIVVSDDITIDRRVVEYSISGSAVVLTFDDTHKLTVLNGKDKAIKLKNSQGQISLEGSTADGAAIDVTEKVFAKTIPASDTDISSVGSRKVYTAREHVGNVDASKLSESNVTFDLTKSTEEIVFKGSAKNDSIVANAHNDTITTGGGNDTVVATSIDSEHTITITDYTAGKDVIEIADGVVESASASAFNNKQSMKLEAGQTTIELQKSGAKAITVYDNVYGRSTQTFNAKGNTIKLADTANDSIDVANALYNTIDASSRTKNKGIIINNLQSNVAWIKGGKGDDYINVNGSQVTVTGGTGNDTIDVSTLGTQRVVVTDYTANQDVIKINTDTVVTATTLEAKNKNVVLTLQDTQTGTTGELQLTNAAGKIVTITDGVETTKLIYGNGQATLKADGKNVTSADASTSRFNLVQTVDITGAAANAQATISAVANSEIVNGSAGNSIKASAGNSILYGGSGNDTFTSGKGNDTIVHGLSGNDVITDYIAGQDVIRLSKGQQISASTLPSGSGVSAADKKAPVLVIGENGSAGTIKLLNGVNKKVSVITESTDGTTKQVEMFFGNGATVQPAKNELKAGETLAASDYDNYVTMLDGSKLTVGITVDGTNFNDDKKVDMTLKGGSGADKIISGTSNDVMIGGGGNDTFVHANGGDDTINDYVADADVIDLDGKSVSDSKLSGKNVVLQVGTDSGSVTVVNGKGKRINVNGTNLIYGDGQATLSISAKDTISSATAQAALVQVIDASASSKNLSLDGNGYATTIKGGKGADSLFGAANTNDLFIGGAKNDTFVYAGGNDTINDYANGDVIFMQAGDASSYQVGVDYSGNKKDTNVYFFNGSEVLTVKNGKGKKLTVVDSGNSLVLDGKKAISKSASAYVQPDLWGSVDLGDTLISAGDDIIGNNDLTEIVAPVKSVAVEDDSIVKVATSPSVSVASVDFDDVKKSVK